MKKLTNVFLVITIFLVALASAIEMNAYNIKYYESFFYENSIDLETGKSQMELKEISEDLISYLRNKAGEDTLEKTFNEKEVSHMIDVQNIFIMLRTVKRVSYIIFFVLLLYYIKKGYLEDVFKTIYKGINYIYIVLISFGILISTNFNKYFIIFHKMFFSNDLWLLDPKTDIMIRMLPEPFFIGMAKNMLISLILMLLIIQILSKLLYRKISRQ